MNPSFMKMKKDKDCKKIAEKALILLRKRGEEALAIATKAVMSEEIAYGPLRSALQYFLQEIRFGAPHSALISLTCEAVGGNPNDTSLIGAAMVLIASAADIHDDIIDNSEVKNSKLTVFGKFGKDLALLAGDVFLFKGLIILHEYCKKLPVEKKERILTLLKDSFFHLSVAEAKEASLKGNFNIHPKEYLDIIREKASVIEMYARIGVVIGGGDLEKENILGQYGRALGMLSIIRDEFIDMYESDEIKNRIMNECPPLPLLYALQNPKIKAKIMKILTKKEVKEDDIYKLIKIVDRIEDVQKLKIEMKKSVEKILDHCTFVKPQVYRELRLLLSATIEDL